MFNILISYAFYTKQHTKALEEFDKSYPGQLRLLIDCGAFTAYTRGRHVELSEYCDFLDHLPVKVWKYFALDVIGDEAATLKNLDAMHDRGYEPVPIVTYGQDLSIIEYYKSVSNLVAYGGLVGRPAAKIAVGIKRVMEVMNGHHLHLLGFTSVPWLKKLRPYSCDSASWNAPRKYGDLMIYMGHGKLEKFRRSAFMKRPPERIIKRLLEFGINPNDAKSIENWKGGRSFQSRTAAASFVALGLDMRKYLGTEYFHVIGANPQDIPLLGSAWARQTNV